MFFTYISSKALSKPALKKECCDLSQVKLVNVEIELMTVASQHSQHPHNSSHVTFNKEKSWVPKL